MASIRARATCTTCRKLFTLRGSKQLLLPAHDCPGAGTKQYERLSWQAKVKDHGKEHYKTGRTRAVVAAWAETRELELETGIREVAPAPLLVDWQERWWTSRVNEPTTMHNDAQKIRTHIIPKWGALRLDEITGLDIQEWVADLAKRRAAETTRKVHNLLSQMLDAAVREDLIVRNPCAYTKLPPSPPGRVKYTSRPEVDALAGVMTVKPYAAVTIVLAYTGLRWGELAGLRISAVDFDAGRIHVARTITRFGEKDYPKSRQRRTIPLPDRARIVLRDHLLEQRTRGPLNPDRLVFLGLRGRPLNDGAYSRNIFPKALAAARIDGKPIGKAARPHDLRHSCASWLVQAGVPLLDVMHWLGHADQRTALRYAHLAPEHGDRALAALNG
jgi:integrase